MGTNGVLVVAGIVCLALVGIALHKLPPRPGKLASVWTDTEMKASATALSLLVLTVAGVGLIVQGMLGR